MLLRFRAVPIVPLLLALPAPCFGLQVEPLGAIMGTVRQADRGPVLVGARVALLGTTFAAITSPRGEFSFNGLTPGKYVIQASAIGFGTLSSEIEVRARETLEVAFEAHPEGVRLPELNVAERPELPSEFVRRSESGGGRYFSRDAIERRNAATLGDLLRTIPGLRVSCTSYPCRIQLMRQRRTCPLAFWLDGAPVDAGSAMLQSPRDLDGVEIYSGLAETPPELYQQGTCGALVVWTRTPPRAVRKPKEPKPVRPDTVEARKDGAR